MGKIGRRINEYLRTHDKISVIYNQGNATDKEFADMKQILALKSIHEVELLVYEKEKSEKKTRIMPDVHLSRPSNASRTIPLSRRPPIEGSPS